MGSHKHTMTVVGQIMKERHDLISSLRIEVARRLVGDYQLRLVKEGPGYDDT